MTHRGLIDAFSTQAARVCDGHDPEGNVFQLRQAVSPAAAL